MKKILYGILISFLFATTSLAIDNEPRELTPKERKIINARIKNNCMCGFREENSREKWLKRRGVEGKGEFHKK